MTRDQKRKVKRQLRAYRELADQKDPAAVLWRESIDDALAYYRGCPAVSGRGDLLRLRYIDGRTEAEVLQQLNVSKSTYTCWQIDAIGTVAVAAARNGLI